MSETPVEKINQTSKTPEKPRNPSYLQTAYERMFPGKYENLPAVDPLTLADLPVAAPAFVIDQLKMGANIEIERNYAFRVNLPPTLDKVTTSLYLGGNVGPLPIEVGAAVDTAALDSYLGPGESVFARAEVEVVWPTLGAGKPVDSESVKLASVVDANNKPTGLIYYYDKGNAAPVEVPKNLPVSAPVPVRVSV